MMAIGKAVKWTIDTVTHPRSTVLHAIYHAKRRKYRKIERIIRKDFDPTFYRHAYPQIRRMNISPLRHFVVVGWREGKDPSALFSTRGYLKFNRDVAQVKVNPFYHYITHGRQEGRVTSVSDVRRTAHQRPTTPLVVPPIPTPEAFHARPKCVVEPPTGEAVNVIIPVYKSLQHVAATIDSVLAAKNETPFECVVVDDCSPEPAVTALLRDLADSGHIRLIVNETNQGFVRSVNRGMAYNEDRDVILLNADTVVHDGWIDRLIEPAILDRAIGTVTPFSNNATIASYPEFAVDNTFELEVPSSEVDRLAARANGRTVVDVPTGIGFCMFIRRAALTEVGLFDADTFGIGYGEECDFCMRAVKSGWRNVLATGVYVRHFGSTSFGASQTSRSEQAQILLGQKHPDYQGRVQRHLAADPALPSRIMLDVARLQAHLGDVSVLFFTHTRGGGIQTFLDNARMALLRDGLEDVVNRAVVARTTWEGFVKLEPFGQTKFPYLPNLESLNLERHKDLLPAMIELLDPELVHMNSFAGLSVPSIARLMDALMSAKRPYWHIWHDHQPLCPRLTFLDAEERYCGETDAERCKACLAATSAPLEWVRIEDWRDRFRRYLAGAAQISAPSEAAALRARRLADVAKVVVHPHPEPLLDNVPPLDGPAASDGKRHILILGAIGPHKGAHLIHAMICDIEARDLPLHIDIVGYTSLREIKNGPKATVYGRYDGDRAAAEMISAIKPDALLTTSIWPETYVFTLSVGMALGLPLISLDLGAQAERTAEYGRGLVIDHHLKDDPVALNDALLAVDYDDLWRRPATFDFASRSALSEYFAGRGSHPARDPAPEAQAASVQPPEEKDQAGKAGPRALETLARSVDPITAHP